LTDLPDYALVNRESWTKANAARRVVGVDVTSAQLETARRMDEEFGLGLELVEANAEDVPLEDASFDMAISEYGASIWCDPYKWIPDAARLLRASGFGLLDLIELYAADDAQDHVYYSYVPAEWARKWPAEEIWRARKSG
jgi:ubiquinone/menaquinone biosynthesis C-methylase UbiE